MLKNGLYIYKKPIIIIRYFLLFLALYLSSSFYLKVNKFKKKLQKDIKKLFKFSSVLGDISNLTSPRFKFKEF